VSVRERFYRGCRAVAQLIRNKNRAEIAASLRDQDLGPLSGSCSLRQVNLGLGKQSSVADYGLLSRDQGQYAAANPIFKIIGMGERNILLLRKANDGAAKRML
jgi:hypothetical protein